MNAASILTFRRVWLSVPGSVARFWSGEWGYGQAVVAVAGCLVVGWLLQWVRGGGPLRPPSWPLNGILLAAFAGWIWFLSRQETRLVAWLGGVPMALASMAGVGVVGLIGGIVPQGEQAPAWAAAWGLSEVFRSVPLVLALLILLTNLGLATLRRSRALGWKGWLVSLNHAGLWLAVAAGLFGAGDVIRARMMLVEGGVEARIVDEAGRLGYLPFGLHLQRFYVEHYPGEPERPGPARRYTAEVAVLHPGGRVEEARIVVNQPLRRAGWALYLIHYELSEEGMTDRCVLEAVRDPWLPAIYSGIGLMLAGAVAMLFKSPWSGRCAESGEGVG